MTAKERRMPGKDDRLAQPIATALEWRDFIASPEKKAEIQSVLAAAESGGRHSALFSGPTGTGKTLAATLIAKSLGREALQIDLRSVVSKYIGETEKNLDRAFEQAEQNGAVLVFDEADALFGKRSEVKDSHDRYANLGVDYLLQRIERFEGVAIVTTNRKANLDPAFVRRLRHVIDFPQRKPGS
jgi:SpoVK/Ycf46/Vps4 family AAA+-type ATPase